MTQYGYHGLSSLQSGTSAQQLTPISNLPTHPYQQGSPGPPPTLPPLNAQHSYSSQQTNGSHPQQPSQQSQAYATSVENSYSQPSGRASVMSEAPRTLSNLNPLSQLQSNSQHQQGNGYQAPDISDLGYSGHHRGGPSSSVLGSSNTLNSSLFGNNFVGQMSLPNLSSSLYGTTNRSPAQPSFANGSVNLLHQPPSILEPEHGTAGAAMTSNGSGLPVVGQQGRRGILPSVVPPRVANLAADQANGTLRSPVNVVKNADGKYPCTYCNKTYQHLKHLKRHHLRHTGERPYSCYLCDETFCRSDILKRHFQKCSQRRGNPTGATHLTYAQAHRKPQAQQAQQQGQQGQSPNPTRLQENAQNNMPPETNALTSNAPPARPTWQNGPSYSHFGGEQAQLPGSMPLDSSNRSSRASSIMARPGSANSEDKKRYSSTNTAHTSVSTSLDNGNANKILNFDHTHVKSENVNGYGSPGNSNISSGTFQQNRLPAMSFGQDNSAGAAGFSFNPHTNPLQMSSTQAENSQNFMYARHPQFQSYGQPQHHSSHGQLTHEPWNPATFFSTGSQNDVMFPS